jgi:NitT/TauT family transport system permease protein
MNPSGRLAALGSRRLTLGAPRLRLGRSADVALRLALLVATLLVWEALVRLLRVPGFILPAPSQIAMALYRGALSGVYLHNLWITLAETLLGFAFGSLIAFVLGTLIAVNRRLEYFLYPYIVMFQSMPKVALAPLLIVWFGIGLTSKVVSAALIAFFPLLVNTIVGLRSVDEDRIDLMRSLAASESQIFWMLRLPSSLTFIMAGLEVAMVFSLIGAIVAEFVGSSAGLGMLIQSMNFNMDVAGQFAVLFILAVLGLGLNTIIVAIRKRVLFWDPSQKSATTVLTTRTGADT